MRHTPTSLLHTVPASHEPSAPPRPHVLSFDRYLVSDSHMLLFELDTKSTPGSQIHAFLISASGVVSF